MSWKEIKKAINGTVGTKRAKTLDEITSDLASDVYYNVMATKHVAEELGGNAYMRVVKYGKQNIAREEFRENTLRAVVIPNTVKSIGESAFYSCSDLYFIVIPDSVKDIEYLAFGNCYNLQNIVVSKNLERIGYSAFRATGIDCISLPATIKSIGNNAFENCNYLTNIYVPWSEGEISGAPWGATNATIHYNSEA